MKGHRRGAVLTLAAISLATSVAVSVPALAQDQHAQHGAAAPAAAAPAALIDDGKPVVSDYFIEHIPPDIGAIKLWLLNRRPDRWREKVEVANTGGLIDRTPDEIKRLLVQKMIEWGLVEIENVPPELLPLPDGTVGEE
jgi:hypothetical protein